MHKMLLCVERQYKNRETTKHTFVHFVVLLESISFCRPAICALGTNAVVYRQQFQIWSGVLCIAHPLMRSRHVDGLVRIVKFGIAGLQATWLPMIAQPVILDH